MNRRIGKAGEEVKRSRSMDRMEFTTGGSKPEGLVTFFIL